MRPIMHTLIDEEDEEYRSEIFWKIYIYLHISVRSLYLPSCVVLPAISSIYQPSALLLQITKRCWIMVTTSWTAGANGRSSNSNDSSSCAFFGSSSSGSSGSSRQNRRCCEISSSSNSSSSSSSSSSSGNCSSSGDGSSGSSSRTWSNIDIIIFSKTVVDNMTGSETGNERPFSDNRKRRRSTISTGALFMNLTITFFAVLVFSTLLATGAAAAADDRETFVPTKIAFCLTGQLARLELLSKLAHIFIPNIRKGNTVHVYMLLDNSPIIKQTFWRYDYSETPYANYNVKKMEEVITKKMSSVMTEKKFKMHVRLGPVSQDEFEVIDGFIPVETKVIDWQQTRDGKGINVEGMEEALPRFQNNMQWLAGLRDCTKWMQQMEQEQGFFYDLVVRLREDTYAFGEWILEGQKLKGALTSAFLGSYRGINDHNLVLDRKYADPLFRGLIEDYYFKGSNKGLMWNNTEHRIYQLATDYGIPIQTASLCQWPLIPLRALENSTHWMLHPAYTEKYYDACVDKLERESRCRCDQNYAWINFFRSGVTPINEPKLP